MEQTTRFTGNAGEELAVEYLRTQGVYILARNFRTKVGEIDIIGSKGNDVIFYEVKYRTNQNFGFGDEAISHGKIIKLKKTIEIWITQNKRDIEFDNVYLNAIVIDGEKNVEEFEIL
jgi:putative endonuclease